MNYSEELTKLRQLAVLADELCTAVDCEAEDIGGNRPSREILADIGPLTDELPINDYKR